MSIEAYRDDAGDVWVQIDGDGDWICLTKKDLVEMNDDVTDEENPTGLAERAGHRWDESQVNLLLAVLAGGATLWACRRCTHRPVLSRNDDLCETCGAADDVAEASIAQTRSAG